MSSRSLSILAVVTTAITLLGAGHAEAGGRYRARHHHHHHGRHYRSPAHVGIFVYPRGLYVGAGLVGSRVLHQDGAGPLLENGAGLSLFSGFRVNRNLALEAGWLGTVHAPGNAAFDDADHLVLNGFTADARVYWQTGTPSVEPFIQGGLGLYLLDSTYFGTQSVGTGFQAGGGFDVLLGEHIKLGLRVLYRGLAMGPPDSASTDSYVGTLNAEGSLIFQF